MAAKNTTTEISSKRIPRCGGCSGPLTQHDWGIPSKFCEGEEKSSPSKQDLEWNTDAALKLIRHDINLPLMEALSLNKDEAESIFKCLGSLSKFPESVHVDDPEHEFHVFSLISNAVNV
ncbi:hypothetical protein OS493_015583 [Desmophyllum pertusum]|uniref:Uncharacterized protein n=1 Tax=Desmophyllum pertusum TaxID=174260 RepID=A0A9W9YP75_9CNID|nr:hypothetical protein OS493_015583 [Desmophyllum pertusum]